MPHPLENRKKEMAEMIALIPKMQTAVRNGLRQHYNNLQPRDFEQVEQEILALQKAIEIIDSKYVLDIIFVLSREGETLYFNELIKILKHVNIGTLSKRLKALEKEGVIERIIFQNERPIRIGYKLTELGFGIFWLLLPLLVYVDHFEEFKEMFP